MQNVNGTWPGEGVYTALAVALSGYANNKGASFQDLLANWVSTQWGGPTDALGNGIVGALNVAGASEGNNWRARADGSCSASTARPRHARLAPRSHARLSPRGAAPCHRWWAGPYVANYGVFPDGSQLTSASAWRGQPLTALSVYNSSAAQWINAQVAQYHPGAALFPQGAPPAADPFLCVAPHRRACTPARGGISQGR